MKNNKYQLENLYLSPKQKDHDSTRKIYLSGGLLSKTSRNQQSKTQNATLR